MTKFKVIITTAVSALMNWLGVLAIPVMLMVACNIIDYATGLIATPYREEKVSSYKGIRGIYKKIGMWLLVLVGAFVDILIKYSIEAAGVPLDIPFIVATVVAVWLVVNEIISILENLVDIGVEIPPFLMPVVKHIKRQVEEKGTLTEEETKNSTEEVKG